MLYCKYSKGREKTKMTTFTMIILALFISALAFQFMMAIERNCLGLAGLFAFEILAFVYLARVLM